LSQNKVFSLLGLATKAGHIISGESLTEANVRGHKAYMVIVANDASDNTKKLFTNLCSHYKVPLYFFGHKNSLGHAIGKPYRASIAVLDNGLSEAIKKQLELLNGEIHNQ
jgi:ribosomal protein L7Ae-like RNA K-turn-binding protein